MKREGNLKKMIVHWNFFTPVTFEIMRWKSYSGGIGYTADHK